MEEILLDNQATIAPVTDTLVFRYLPAFAGYIRDNKLLPYIKEQLIISREVSLPMLRFFKDLSEDDLLAMSVPSHTEFLTSVVENRVGEQLDKSLKRWMEDQLGIMKREEITAEDITLASYIRKKAMMKFLPEYTTDVSAAVDIIKEIDEYNVAADTACSNVYLKLLKDRLHEQALFTDAISNTTPGLNYVFSLAERSLTYANRNAMQFFGFDFKELQGLGAEVIDTLVYEDDKAITAEGLVNCAAASDGAVISWEFRLRNVVGEYIWMRNYSSVFKRDAEGRPTEIVGIILDVANEKEIAGQLLMREKQLLEAQAQAMVGSFELDVESGKMDVTPQFKEIYEVNDFDLYTLIDRVHPADRERINANRDRAIKEDGVYDNEYRYITGGREKILWSRGVITYKNGRKTMIGTAMDVTSRHELVRKLLESEDLYKQAQARTHIGNWTWDIKADKVSWSDEMFRVYGLEPQSQEVNYETYLSHIHPDDKETRMQQVQHVFETGEPEDHHYRIITPEGTVRILHTKSELHYDDEGKPAIMVGTCQDVTEKELLIEQLKESERLYKQAQAISHIGNWTWDLPTKQLEWSDEVYRIYDLEPQSLTDSNSLDQYNHPDDAEMVSELMKQAVITQQPFDFYYRIITDKGRQKILHAKGEVAGIGSRTAKIYGTLQDVTEQHLIERQLKDYQEFIEKITDVTPSIITSYNIHTGQYSFVNEAIEKLLGYSPALVMEEGVSFVTSIVHPDDLAYIEERNRRALAEANELLHNDNEPITEFKYRMRNKSGEYRWFHTYGTIFERNEAGLVESVLNVSVDITEQEAAEQALFRKNLQLQQSNASLEEYAYVASHDLKEPLRKIATFSDRILSTQQDTLNDEGKVFLNKIIDSSRRMQKMIGDLLSVSTILGNKVFEQHDLAALFSEALQALDHKIEESGAVVTVDQLPEVTVVGTQFRQLFQNLVSNSLKFARKEVSPVITVNHKFLTAKEVSHLNMSKAKKYLQIVISDNGIGFDNQYAAKIFAIFQRLHGKTEYDGTGIGLSVCKKIVENHDGVIHSEGRPNEGATFTIIIPVVYN